jgi:hypothetical protein
MIHNGFWVVLDALDVSVLENIRKAMIVNALYMRVDRL